MWSLQSLAVSRLSSARERDDQETRGEEEKEERISPHNTRSLPAWVKSGGGDGKRDCASHQSDRRTCHEKNHNRKK